MTFQEEAHRAISQAHQHTVYDYGIWSDGSGYTDGFAGYAVLIQSYDVSGDKDCKVGALFGQDVERAEFEGLLAGLASVTEREIRINGKNSLRFRRRKLAVRWVTDRESLALSAWRKPDGGTLYGRESCPDLWARFGYYEEFIELVPVFSKRMTDETHNIADRLASEARILCKEWVLTQQADGRFPIINTYAIKPKSTIPDKICGTVVSRPAGQAGGPPQDSADSRLAPEGHAPAVDPQGS